MIVAVGCDHGGFPLKEFVLKAIQEAGHTTLDLGTHNTDRVDYPDFSEMVGEAVCSGKAERGVLICSTGVGVCIAANKIKGIYASVCHDIYSAHQGVEHDNMNVLCLGAYIIGRELARELVKAFLAASFFKEERFRARHLKTMVLEDKS